MPRVTISINAPDTNKDSKLIVLDLPPGITVGDLKAVVQSETNFPAPLQKFFRNGMPITGDSSLLEDLGVKDGEFLALLIQPPVTGGGQRVVHQQQVRDGDLRRPRCPPSAEAIETLRLGLLNSPVDRMGIAGSEPELINNVHDATSFRERYLEIWLRDNERIRERQDQLVLLNQDPFNLEAQKRIEYLIRQDQVNENAQHAYEHNPEVFVRVTMLYIFTEVNGHPVKAFVDSGAQETIMSPSCADACNIMRLVDTRYAGIAKGVGTATVLGRVHHAEIKIGGAVMPCAFTVMEGKDVELLFGLDMLKRYKACIDLSKNALCFQGIEVPFLPESEIPKKLGETHVDKKIIATPKVTKEIVGHGTLQPSGQQDVVMTGSPAEMGPSASVSTEGSSRVTGETQQSTHQWAGAGEAQPKHAEATIGQLQSLGFSRERVMAALDAAGGNLEYAANFLLG